jgi:hypothetical protein
VRHVDPERQGVLRRSKRRYPVASLDVAGFAGVPFLELTLNFITVVLHRTAHVPIWNTVTIAATKVFEVAQTALFDVAKALGCAANQERPVKESRRGDHPVELGFLSPEPGHRES